MDAYSPARGISCLKSDSWKNTHRAQRRHKTPGSDQRIDFERDRDRLLYSSAFQRLAGITQIVRAGEANVFHTRQQHTLKVAQVGRRLAQKLLKDQRKAARHRGLHPEVVEAACIAHDLGHPPFGHVGEQALDNLVKENGDADGFEGNAQSFRIITKLAVRFDGTDGLNLTRATLAACLKYPWFRGSSGKAAKKWSAYNSEKDDFVFAREHHDHAEKSLEAELMDWADDVAYSVHDLEDFHRCNALPWRKVVSERDAIIDRASEHDRNNQDLYEKAFDRLFAFLDGAYSALLEQPYEGTREQREQLRRMTSQLIGKFITGISINEDLSSSQAVKFDQNYLHDIKILKQITRDYIINSPILAAQQHGQKRIINELFGYLFDGHDTKTGEISFLPMRLRYLKAMAGTSRARFVADCIASLSESEAMGLHARLTGTSTGSILDPIVR